ncbi:MAG: aminotransferase class I/II [Bdellovibrionaceae bacterium]|nr:aminotransferase class I/II [Pseudobdellovibrionaceae bacterium]
MNSTPTLLNPNILSLRESATLAINQTAKKLRSKGETVYHWGFGQSPFEVPQSIQDALKKASHHKEYLPTLGLLELREAISDFYHQQYGYSFHPDHILIGPGSKELIFQALFILEGPLLIPAPSWVSYGPQAQIRGKKVVPIQTQEKHGYKLQPEEFLETCKKLESESQKVLIINNPNNPTGSVYTDLEIQKISKICKEHNVIVISDEIYALCDFSGREYQGFSRYCPERTIVTGGLSKGLSAGGYRLGFLAAPGSMASVVKTLCAMVSETFSAVSAPIQYAAIPGFQNNKDIREYAQVCTSIHQVMGEYFHTRFTDMGLTCPLPEGAFYLFPNFEPFRQKLASIGIYNSNQLCHALLKSCRIAVLPASDFYCPNEMLAVRVATVDYNGANVFKSALQANSLDSAFVEKHCPQIKKGCDSLELFLKSLE